MFSGAFQIVTLIIFTYTPLEGMFNKGGGILKYIFYGLFLLSFILALIGSLIEPEECKTGIGEPAEGNNCNFLTTKITMIVVNVLASILIFTLLYTTIEDQYSTITSAGGLILIVILSVFYATYATNFRGAICLCDIDIEGNINTSNCNALPNCTCV